MILVANPRGGCGKTTAAMQLLAPWMLERTGKSSIIEINNDEHRDVIDFAESQIQLIPISVSNELSVAAAVDQLMSRDDKAHVIADLGGNRTSDLAMQHIGAHGYDAFIKMIVIPVSAGGVDVIYAGKTLENIREWMPAYKGSITLVITRAESADISTVKQGMPDAFRLIDEEELSGPVLMETNMAFPGSRMLKMTAWEIAEQSAELTKEMKETLSVDDEDYERVNTLIADSIIAGQQLATPFEELDKIVDLRPVAC